MVLAGPVWGVVLGAGRGSRFGSRKQFELVGMRRLIDLAVEASLEGCDHTAVVLPPGSSWNGTKVDLVVGGGETRSASVRAALTELPADAGIVVLHDAAHPLASPSLFDTVVAAVRAGATAAVPGVRPSEVVHRVRNGEVVEDVGRDALVLVQMPCAFRSDVLRAAYASATKAVEESQLVSALGETVAVVAGDRRNVHVVTAEDLEIVRCLTRTA